VADRDAATINCDRTLMLNVFQNLLANAIKFTRHRSPALIEVGAEEINGRTAIFVRDNGAGFNMKYVDKLFVVFQRLHRVEEFEGTGVGLATVQRILAGMRARYWAESEVDKGATFYFTIGRGQRDRRRRRIRMMRLIDPARKQ